MIYLRKKYAMSLIRRQESPENPPGKSLPNRPEYMFLSACTKYMYLNVIMCTPVHLEGTTKRPKVRF